ncbi:hypothetical protein EXIGLDRAFT_765887 [Exidia glandulosa HHB12029]|uniref:Uncharacterized protein n=1 Tax=Exidia glandulosa HHB12029 TaxID=1314781 RepID=A0A166AWN7_EXIGL|nr:hypothetical protein EXIGLDRAFT_765887 [Exidia glandulosa HHB12029]
MAMWVENVEGGVDLLKQTICLGVIAEGLCPSLDEEEIQQQVFDVNIYNKDYAPYPSEEMLFTDMLDNFPCLRLSNAHMEDMANPQVAEHLIFYPKLKPSSITNTWEMSWWLELLPDQLIPMVHVGLHKFFVNKLALLHSGEFVIPYMWVTYEGVLSGLCHKCTYNETTHVLTVLETTTHVEVALLVCSNFLFEVALLVCSFIDLQ